MTTPDPDAVERARAALEGELEHAALCRHRRTSGAYLDFVPREQCSCSVYECVDDFEQAVRRAVLAECVCGHAESEHAPGIPNEDDTERVWAGCRPCIAADADAAPPWHAYESVAAALARLPGVQS